MPGREALYEPGRSDGQTKMVREGSGVTCYSWSAAEGEWTKIGDVMGAQAAPGKTLFNGKVKISTTLITQNVSLYFFIAWYLKSKGIQNILL